jgi:hypothetical protein
MEVGDWITLAAVIVALGIGVASILHTESLRKRDRRERLVTEIVNWVEDVISVTQSLTTNRRFELTLDYSQYFVQLDILNAKKNYLLGLVNNRDVGNIFIKQFSTSTEAFNKYYKGNNKNEGEEFIRVMVNFLTFVGEYKPVL